jgi:hypothetical protein
MDYTRQIGIYNDSTERGEPKGNATQQKKDETEKGWTCHPKEVPYYRDS